MGVTAGIVAATAAVAGTTYGVVQQKQAAKEARQAADAQELAQQNLEAQAIAQQNSEKKQQEDIAQGRAAQQIRQKNQVSMGQRATILTSPLGNTGTVGGATTAGAPANKTVLGT